jgi:hypothetical protein
MPPLNVLQQLNKVAPPPLVAPPQAAQINPAALAVQSSPQAVAQGAQTGAAMVAPLAEGMTSLANVPAIVQAAEQQKALQAQEMNFKEREAAAKEMSALARVGGMGGSGSGATVRKGGKNQAVWTTYDRKEAEAKAGEGGKIDSVLGDDGQELFFVADYAKVTDTSPDAIDSIAMKIASYDMPISDIPKRSPKFFADVISRVKEYNPSWVPIYSLAEKENAIKNQQRMRSFNSALGHMETLLEKSKQYKRWSEPGDMLSMVGLTRGANIVGKKLATGQGSERLQAYMGAAQELASELAYLFSGSGGQSAMQDREHMLEALSPNLSHKELEAYLDSVKELMAKKANDIIEPYVKQREEVFQRAAEYHPQLKSYDKPQDYKDLMKKLGRGREGEKPGAKAPHGQRIVGKVYVDKESGARARFQGYDESGEELWDVLPEEEQ